VLARAAPRIAAALGALTVAVASASAPTEATAPPVAAGSGTDGVLRIGLLLPQSGTGGTIGLPASSAARSAITEINASGGFGDHDVELISEDEGDSAERATDAIRRLLDQGVDAVVGPASSNVALATLDQLMNAGVLTCSPTASTLLLDHFPNRSLFFRTIPSDSLQMAVVAGVVEQQGRNSALVYYANDEYGQGLVDAVESQFAARTQVEIAELVPLEIDDPDLTDEARRIGAHPDSTVVVLAGAEQGLAILQALNDAITDLQLSAPGIIVNDAVHGSPEFYLGLREDVRKALRRIGPVAWPPSPAPSDTTAPPMTAADASGAGPSEPQTTTPQTTGPATTTPDDQLPAGPFALNSYDCVNLIALAAQLAGTDDPRRIAEQMGSAASGGRTCVSYPECIDLHDQGLDFNYNGRNATNTLFQFGDDGDLSRAYLMTYGVLDDTGVEREFGALAVTE